MPPVAIAESDELPQNTKGSETGFTAHSFTLDQAAMAGAVNVPEVLVHGNRANTLPIPAWPVYKTVEESLRVQKEHLAAAFRLFGKTMDTRFGAGGHMSLRDPTNPHLMWMNPFGQPYSTIQPEDLVCIDEDGYVVEGVGNQCVVNSAGVHIHLGLHKARPDINAAVHTHSDNGVAWSTFGRKIEMLNQDTCAFVDDQAIVKFNGIVTAAEEGLRIAEQLGKGKTVAILENHGLLTVGQTIDEAAYRFLLMDKLCGIQLKTNQAGLPKKIVSDEEARKNAKISSSPFFMYTNFQTELKNLERLEGRIH